MKKNSFLRKTKTIGFISEVLFCFLFFITDASAIKIQDIHSSKGVHAWLVEDYTVPVIAMQFSFKGGAAQDPVGKEGLTNLMSALLDEGAGDIRFDAFRMQLNDLGADMAFSVTGDSVRGHLYVLAKNCDKAIDLLALTMQKSRFDQDVIDRIRDQLIANIHAYERDPIAIAQNKFSAMVYGNHPYSRRFTGTIETLEKIVREDLVSAHAHVFARDNLKIGIVGPVSSEKVEEILDRVFGSLPQKAKLKSIKNAKLYLGGMTTVHYEIPQTSIILLYPGVSREDPDFFAAYLANCVLGGPGLVSRLFTEIREKRGLAYSVSSHLQTFHHASILTISTGTRADRARESLEMIRNEVKRMTIKGITADELSKAKSYIIGSFAVQNMGSSPDIASTLVCLQEYNLPVNYIENRAALVNAVTLDSVNAIAKKLFHVEPAILIVGAKSREG
ncbi:MAG: zinc protease [Candidatus Tokpelaia sp. JSC085]|nr:MAG: zinc protease [Candidatus Tokpelaia sp. JSC085]